jgi:thiol:disulfide interchange protein
LQQLRAEGKTVLIDFTADWCFTCKLNKPWALHSKGTEEYMRQHGIVGLVADKTEDAPDIDSLMTRLDHASGMIPFYAVFPGNGGPVITYNQGPLWEGLLLDMLRRAGPSRSASRPIETAHR